MRDRKLPSFLTFLFLPALFFLVFSACVFFNNRSFRQFTGQIFRNELAGNTLNLHYTLKHPENYGISEAPVTLGSAEPEVLEASGLVLENYQEALRRFPYQTLSKTNRPTISCNFIFKISSPVRNLPSTPNPLVPPSVLRLSFLCFSRSTLSETRPISRPI